MQAELLAPRRTAESMAPMAELERYRRPLTGHCRRQLGSSFEAEDAVQETLVRAWRRWDQFEERAALYSWLYRIATNVCLDMLQGRQRRAHPRGLAPSALGIEASPVALSTRAAPWTRQPIRDRALAGVDDPAERVVSRDAVRSACLVALQRLPRRQRAALILCEVLRWKAHEAAELLDATVTSVRSALQRARASLAASDAAAWEQSGPLDDGQRRLVARFVDAFERADIEALVSLL